MEPTDERLKDEPMDAAMQPALPALSECWFYHRMDLPGVGLVGGDWDLRGRFSDYIGGVDLTGRSVLDVGTASGFLSFEAERCGASAVTSYAAAAASQLQRNPGYSTPVEKFERERNGYRLAHHLLKSRAALVQGDVYRLADFAPLSDVVIVGQLLVHLRDPLGALEQAAKCAHNTLILVEGMFEHPQPMAVYLGGTTPYSWFHFSITLYREFLAKLGFDIVRVTPGQYRCVAQNKDETVWTLVARRHEARDFGR